MELDLSRGRDHMDKAVNRRKRIIVNSEVQGRIIKTISWPPAICLAATALLLSVFCMRLTNEASDADIDLPSLVPVLMTVGGFLVVAMLFILFNALHFSHRVAGPMYRINKTLEAVQQGDLDLRVKLRDGDFLGEVADSINHMLEWLGEHPPSAIESSQDGTSDEAEDAVTISGSPESS